MDNSNTTHLKREVLVRLIRAFINQEMGSIRELPFQMRPKNGDAPYRCCIYKERAILRQRAIAGLGCSVETDDEMTSLNEYAKQAMERKNRKAKFLRLLMRLAKAVYQAVYMLQSCVRAVSQDRVFLLVNLAQFRLKTAVPLLTAKNAKTAVCVSLYARTVQL